MAIYREWVIVGAIVGDCADAVADGWTNLDDALAYLVVHSFGDVELCVGAVFIEKLVRKTIKISSSNSELRFSINGHVVL